MASEYLNNKTFEILICRFQNAKRERKKYELILEDIKETVQRTAKRNKFQEPDSWAVIKEKFEAVVREYNYAQQDVAVAFYTLAQNIARYRRFNFIDEDDAIQEGVMICFDKIDRFDPNKGKAFNYMTTCVQNHLKQLYRTNRNYNELKRKYQEFKQFQEEFPRNRNRN